MAGILYIYILSYKDLYINNMCPNRFINSCHFFLGDYHFQVASGSPNFPPEMALAAASGALLEEIQRPLGQTRAGENRPNERNLFWAVLFFEQNEEKK